MSYEYRLRIDVPDQAAVAESLRRLPLHLATEGNSLALRFVPGDGIADAYVFVQRDGFYLQDSRSRGHELFGLVLARMIEDFGKVTVAEAE